ncbi:tetratricopeptide repeat protein [Comamonas fluminis]|uniref:tetratricopeptide repeat protein n=1 Tax=Comamonas fluminis TaxID=2796366 RepID=UPI001C4509E6|nr:tetratricopeptide repeat protein [Comamonas fluminis]
MRFVLPCLSLAALALAGCAVQTPQEQLAPSSPTVRLCEGNNCSEMPRNVTTFRGEPVNPEAERRLAALTARAEADPRAAYDLGLRYLRGDGVERNSYQAIEWMRKAGNAGHGPAQFALGRIYLLGFEEMGADPAEAEAWLSRAAAKGYKEARRLLPQAQAMKRDAHARYQAIEDERKSWGVWYVSSPYYWVWGPSGWYLR